MFNKTKERLAILFGEQVQRLENESKGKGLNSTDLLFAKIYAIEDFLAECEDGVGDESKYL